MLVSVSMGTNFLTLELSDSFRVGLGDGGMEEKGKTAHGHGQGGGDCGAVGGIMGINSKGRNKQTNKPFNLSHKHYF